MCQQNGTHALRHGFQKTVDKTLPFLGDIFDLQDCRTSLFASMALLLKVVNSTD